MPADVLLCPACCVCPPSPTQLQVLCDRNQSFVRLLGLELGPEGPPCQRFAGVVDGGILLRLVSWIEKCACVLQQTACGDCCCVWCVFLCGGRRHSDQAGETAS
jgi:hypothetical protein